MVTPCRVDFRAISLRTIVERLSDFDEKNNVVGFKYRYVRLAVEPTVAARMIEAGPVCLGEMHFLPNGSAQVAHHARRPADQA